MSVIGLLSKQCLEILTPAARTTHFLFVHKRKRFPSPHVHKKTERPEINTCFLVVKLGNVTRILLMRSRHSKTAIPVNWARSGTFITGGRVGAGAPRFAFICHEILHVSYVNDILNGRIWRPVTYDATLKTFS